MKNNKRGQIATLLTLGLVIVGTLIALGTSLFVNNQKTNLALNSRAATTCAFGDWDCATANCNGQAGCICGKMGKGFCSPGNCQAEQATPATGDFCVPNKWDGRGGWGCWGPAIQVCAPQTSPSPGSSVSGDSCGTIRSQYGACPNGTTENSCNQRLLTGDSDNGKWFKCVNNWWNGPCDSQEACNGGAPATAPNPGGDVNNLPGTTGNTKPANCGLEGYDVGTGTRCNRNVCGNNGGDSGWTCQSNWCCPPAAAVPPAGAATTPPVLGMLNGNCVPTYMSPSGCFSGGLTCDKSRNICVASTAPTAPSPAPGSPGGVCRILPGVKSQKYCNFGFTCNISSNICEPAAAAPSPAPGSLGGVCKILPGVKSQKYCDFGFTCNISSNICEKTVTVPPPATANTNCTQRTLTCNSNILGGSTLVNFYSDQNGNTIKFYKTMLDCTSGQYLVLPNALDSTICPPPPAANAGKTSTSQPFCPNPNIPHIPVGMFKVDLCNANGCVKTMYPASIVNSVIDKDVRASWGSVKTIEDVRYILRNAEYRGFFIGISQAVTTIAKSIDTSGWNFITINGFKIPLLITIKGSIDTVIFQTAYSGWFGIAVNDVINTFVNSVIYTVCPPL